MNEALNTLAKLMDPAKFSETLASAGVAAEQGRAAFDALWPALAATMRRRAADPRGLAEMMGLVKPKPDFAASLPGGEALGRLFGSREVTAAVIDTVAATSGVDRRVLEIALPLATEQTMAAFAETLKANPLTEALAPLVEPKPRSAPTLDEILTDTIGPNTSRLVGETLKKTPNPIGPTNVFGEILGEFLRGFNNGGPPIDEPVAPEDEVPPPGRTVGRLFEAGRFAQSEQQKAIEAILDRFWADAAELAAASKAGDAPA
ncbi:MAG: DUF937 domain-containing protein [Hyphomicrobiales bacterium]|nr:DUF937 domain-containing protein [Hyphomicrobiales bacterium]